MIDRNCSRAPRVEREFADLGARRQPIFAEQRYEQRARLWINRQIIGAQFTVDEQRDILGGIRIAFERRGARI